MLADARPPALLAFALPALVLADACPPALLALAPEALVRADARPALPALVRADARPPALLALAPDALVLADTARLLLLRGAPCRVGLLAHPPRRLPAKINFETARDRQLPVKWLRVEREVPASGVRPQQNHRARDGGEGGLDASS